MDSRSFSNIPFTKIRTGAKGDRVSAQTENYLTEYSNESAASPSSLSTSSHSASINRNLTTDAIMTVGERPAGVRSPRKLRITDFEFDSAAPALLKPTVFFKSTGNLLDSAGRGTEVGDGDEGKAFGLVRVKLNEVLYNETVRALGNDISDHLSDAIEDYIVHIDYKKAKDLEVGAIIKNMLTEIRQQEDAQLTEEVSKIEEYFGARERDPLKAADCAENDPNPSPVCDPECKKYKPPPHCDSSPQRPTGSQLGFYAEEDEEDDEC